MVQLVLNEQKATQQEMDLYFSKERRISFLPMNKKRACVFIDYLLNPTLVRFL
jgi:hypothetical protein